MLVALSFHKFRHVSLNSDVIGWELKCLNIYWCLNARLCFKKVGRDGPVRHSGRTGIRPQRDRPTEAYLYRPFNGYFCCCNSKLKIYRIKTVNRFTDFFFVRLPLIDSLFSFLGTTMFWVAMETHPELNEKIELMVIRTSTPLKWKRQNDEVSNQSI